MQPVAPVPEAASRKRRRVGASRVVVPDDVDDSIRRLLAIVDEEAPTGEVVQVRLPGRRVPVRKVYYCSRTHTQLAQVMAELSKILKCAAEGGSSSERIQRMTASLLAVTLSSRKNSCINGAVTRASAVGRGRDGGRA